MHRRIVVALSCVLFFLVANITTVIVDVNDRSAPTVLGVRQVLSLDFSRSGLSDPEAFEALAGVDRRERLGLLKVAPDLSNGSRGKVFVAIAAPGSFPSHVDFFGDEPVAVVRGPEALAHSAATGQYLLTGREGNLDAFMSWLGRARVGYTVGSTSLADVFVHQLSQGVFALPLVAASLLVAALALYWLSAKARGRAVRTLAGVPPVRIQLEDAGGFLACVLLGGLMCWAGSCGYVALRHGTQFVGVHARLLGALVAFLCTVAAVVVSTWGLLSRPTVDSLAHRTSPLVRLQPASNLLKLVTFVIVVAAVSPTVDAFAMSARTAADLAQWKSLSQYVSLTFSGYADADFERRAAPFVTMVDGMNRDGGLLFSYSLSDTEQPTALVNRAWLARMEPTTDLASALAPLSWGDLPAKDRALLEANLALWAKDRSRPTTGLTLARWVGSERLALARGGSSGSLVFENRPVLLVVENPVATLDGSFLISVASTGNLLFQGLGQTGKQLAAAGLDRNIYARYAAEDGILAAQYAALTAWLQGVAVLAVFVALVVAVAMAALIAAVLSASRDFPLRLDGRSWSQIVRRRLLVEVGGALVACGLVVGWQSRPRPEAVAVVVLTTVACVAAAHVVAVSWCFARTRDRVL